MAASKFNDVCGGGGVGGRGGEAWREEGSTAWSPKCDFEELGAPTAGWHVESTTALAGRASGASGGGHGHEQWQCQILIPLSHKETLDIALLTVTLSRLLS